MPTDRPLAKLLPDARSRRAAAIIVLMLRLALGVSTLNAGLIGYLSQSFGSGGSPMRFQNPNMGMNMYGGGSGSAPIGMGLQFLAAGQIGLGVAVLLGFSTTITAAATGFLTILPSLIYTFFLIGVGMTSDFSGAPNPGIFARAIHIEMSNGIDVPTLLLVSLVVWLSSLGITPLSLDALILARRTGATRGKSSPTSSVIPESVKAADRSGPE